MSLTCQENAEHTEQTSHDGCADAKDEMTEEISSRSSRNKQVQVQVQVQVQERAPRAALVLACTWVRNVPRP
eukprot:COSAG06_NODE_24_length_32981_cov_25.509671_26_plen_72_part_00